MPNAEKKKKKSLWPGGMPCPIDYGACVTHPWTDCSGDETGIMING